MTRPLRTEAMAPPAHLPPRPPVPVSSHRVPSGPAAPLLPEPTPELAKASLGAAFSLLLWLRAVPGVGSRPPRGRHGAGEVFLLGLGFLYQY